MFSSVCRLPERIARLPLHFVWSSDTPSRVESIGDEVELLKSGKEFDRRVEALTRNGRLKTNTTLDAEVDVG